MKKDDQDLRKENRRLKKELRFTKISLEVNQNNLSRLLTLQRQLVSTLKIDHIADILFDSLDETVNYDFGLFFQNKGVSFELAQKRQIDHLSENQMKRIQELLKEAYASREEVLIRNEKGVFHDDPSNVKSLLCIPVIYENKIQAFSVLASREDDIFPGEVRELIKLFVNQAGIAVEKAALYEELQAKNIQIESLNRELYGKNIRLEKLVQERTEKLDKMTVALISVLENANQYNDEDTGQHIKRVSYYSFLISERAKLSKELREEIKLYSALHDIGKVGIPHAILNKPGRFTDAEFEEMKKHVEIGYKMVENAPISAVAKNIIRYHHEKFDGNGYAAGLSGDKIPVEARVVALADVFDALTSKRTYKRAMPFDKAIEIITEGRGSHFDPAMVDIFLKCLPEIRGVMVNNPGNSALQENTGE